MAMNHHEMLEWWMRQRHEASEELARIVGGCSPPSTEEEVCDRLAHAIKCGSPCEIAAAQIAASEWAHANLEVELYKKMSYHTTEGK